MIENYEQYQFDDIQIGMKKKFNVKITEKMLDNFALFSGDYNPLHMDLQYAKSTKFGKRICHGMLLSSFFSRLIGMHIPGKRALYLIQSLKFLSPCFINDIITVSGEVISKSPSSHIITLRTKIVNNSDVRLVTGEAKVLVMN